jgi:hypothetical protein
MHPRGYQFALRTALSGVKGQDDMNFTQLIRMAALSLVSALALCVQLGAQTQPSYSTTDSAPRANHSAKPLAQRLWPGERRGHRLRRDPARGRVYWGTLTDINAHPSPT